MIKITREMALGIIDMQECFIPPDGSLAVAGGKEILTPIFSTSRNFPSGQIFTTEDAHPEDHCSFSENGGQWPKHGVRGTEEAKINMAIERAIVGKCDLRWLKGGEKDHDAFGAFWDNDGNRSGLTEQLRWRGFKTLFMCGVAGDICVAETAKQAAEDGFEVYIIEDAIACVLPGKWEEKKAELDAAGVKFISFTEIIDE